MKIVARPDFALVEERWLGDRESEAAYAHSELNIYD